MRVTSHRGRSTSYEATLFGDWENFDSGVRYIKSEQHMEGIVDDLERLGFQIQFALKKHILTQDMPWKELSSVTIARKGGREEILIDSLGYAESIISQASRKWHNIAELTVWPDGTVADRGVSYQQVARWHEYGTRHMPERPLWRPVMEEVESMEAFKALQSLNHLMAVMVPSR